MKGQDVLIIVKLFLWPKEKWSIAAIAQSVNMSDSETHAAIKRCEKADLFNPLTRKVKQASLEELVVYGIKYAFPAELGTVTRGMPTAYSVPPLSKSIVSEKKDVYVWPYVLGKSRGISIKPLYSSVPMAAEKDDQLYEFLALIDCLRVGMAREKNMAVEELVKRIRQ